MTNLSPQNMTDLSDAELRAAYRALQSRLTKAGRGTAQARNQADAFLVEAKRRGGAPPYQWLISTDWPFPPKY